MIRTRNGKRKKKKKENREENGEKIAMNREISYE